MKREGHVGVGLLVCSLPTFSTSALGEVTLGIAVTVAFCGLTLLPDADLFLPLGHRRGITHTVWFAANVGVVAAGFGGSWAAEYGVLAIATMAVLWFLVGVGAVLTHVAADALVPPGVEPLWPLDDRAYLYAVAPASNRSANVVLLLVGATIWLLAFLAGGWLAG